MALGDDVVKTTIVDIVGPTITTNNPLGNLDKHVLVVENLTHSLVGAKTEVVARKKRLEGLA